MPRTLRLLCISLISVLAAQAQTNSVVTVAGGYVGNHKPALSASFARPSGVALDSHGNMYIADTNNCVIRKINTAGTVINFAGTGICGFSGDGGQAWTAMLSLPHGLVFDVGGDLLVADQDNHRIRKITPSGVISTIAGNGTPGYTGDGGPATAASLAAPQDLAIDTSGNLYIADLSNFVVRVVDSSGIIHTVAGNHTNGYSGDGGPATAAQMGNPQAVALDGNGNLYIAESSGHVRRVDSSGTITTVAGNGTNGNAGDGGPGTSAAIGFLDGLSFKAGLLYISSTSSIWALDVNSGLIHLIGNTSVGQGFGGDGGLATNAVFAGPQGMAVDGGGDLFIADSGNNRIREITAGSQIVTTVAGGYLGDGRQARDASLNLQTQGGHISFDRNGNLYIADGGGGRVRKVTPNGIITTVAGNGTVGYSGDGGPATSAQLSGPSAAAMDSQGNLFIADTGNGVIRKVDGSGIISTLRPNGLSFGPYIFASGAGLVVDSFDNIFFSDGLTVVWKVDPGNNATIVAGTYFGFGFGGDGGPATKALLLFPYGIALDGAGNLYIADWLNNRIRKVDGSGTITTVAGNGVQGFSGNGGPATAASLFLPTDVTADSAGNLYIADWINFRVRTVDQSGTIQPLVGAGGFGYNGDRLSAGQTNVFPIGVTVSPAGQLYFADSASGRVRKVRK